jgi:hypothetical protein
LRRINTKLMYLLFCCMACLGSGYSAIPVEVVAEFFTSVDTILVETRLIQNQTELDGFLQFSHYDSATATQKLKNIDFETKTVFSFIGWPCLVDSVIEKTNSVVVYYAEKYPRDVEEYGARPASIAIVFAFTKTAKSIVFVNTTVATILGFGRLERGIRTTHAKIEGTVDLMGRNLRPSRNSRNCGGIIINKKVKFLRID